MDDTVTECPNPTQCEFPQWLTGQQLTESPDLGCASNRRPQPFPTSPMVRISHQACWESPAPHGVPRQASRYTSSADGAAEPSPPSSLLSPLHVQVASNASMGTSEPPTSRSPKPRGIRPPPLHHRSRFRSRGRVPEMVRTPRRHPRRPARSSAVRRNARLRCAVRSASSRLAKTRLEFASFRRR